MNLKAKIGRNIADIRRALGWSQAELAGKIPISREYLSAVERGRSGLSSFGLIERIAKTTKQPESLLLDLSGFDAGAPVGTIYSTDYNLESDAEIGQALLGLHGSMSETIHRSDAPGPAAIAHVLRKLVESGILHNPQGPALLSRLIDTGTELLGLQPREVEHGRTQTGQGQAGG